MAFNSWGSFQTDICTFLTAKPVLKSIKDFHIEFSYCTCRKIRKIYSHSTSVCIKKTVLENALRYSFDLLSPARFSEIDGENSLPVSAFLKKIF